MCGGQDNSIFSSLAPSETLIEFPWHPWPVISAPAFGVAMEMASFVCWPMRYNILNRQNGLIWTAEVSFLHKLALMEFALSQVWFLQMEMRIFCASVWGSLTLSRFPLITASLSNGKVGRVNINVRSAERKFEVLFSFVVHCEWLRYLLHLVCLWILSLFPYFSVSVCVLLFFFYCI